MSRQWLGLLFVLASSLTEAAGQLAFKRSATASGDHGVLTVWHALRASPLWIGLGIACFAATALLFSAALRLLDLIVAFPAGSLTFVAVVFLSRLWLGEAVGIRRWAGVVLILCGTMLLGVG